jgi:hypothetical protein
MRRRFFESYQRTNHRLDQLKLIVPELIRVTNELNDLEEPLRDSTYVKMIEAGEVPLLYACCSSKSFRFVYNIIRGEITATSVMFRKLHGDSYAKRVENTEITHKIYYLDQLYSSIPRYNTNCGCVIQ